MLTAHFGLAILATTVLVKAAFFPLANKSYESMAKMKKLQPTWSGSASSYKDDRARQQQELMALYQKQKINPMSGCLPIVLQIPVFFALYKVLFVTIDMRHAPFYGWIKDLSAPDPTSLFNLFGLLPFALPDFLHVGAWPHPDGHHHVDPDAAQPAAARPIQQKIFNWMPVLFTFMLASFPSGLVIYWAWNNILSLLQQYAIMRKNNTEVHLWKNLGLEKWLNGSKSASAHFRWAVCCRKRARNDNPPRAKDAGSRRGQGSGLTALAIQRRAPVTSARPTPSCWPPASAVRAALAVPEERAGAGVPAAGRPARAGFCGPLQCRQVEPRQCACRPARPRPHVQHARPHAGAELLPDRDTQLYLVDMPGYGFAKAPKQKVEAWTALVRAYLRGRPTLARVFLLIDSRHGLKPPDQA